MKLKISDETDTDYVRSYAVVWHDIHTDFEYGYYCFMGGLIYIYQDLDLKYLSLTYSNNGITHTRRISGKIYRNFRYPCEKFIKEVVDENKV